MVWGTGSLNDESEAKPGRQPAGLSLCLAASLQDCQYAPAWHVIALLLLLSVCVSHICLQARPPLCSMRQEASGVGEAGRERARERERDTGTVPTRLELPVSSSPHTRTGTGPQAFHAWPSAVVSQYALVCRAPDAVVDNPKVPALACDPPHASARQEQAMRPTDCTALQRSPISSVRTWLFPTASTGW